MPIPEKTYMYFFWVQEKQSEVNMFDAIFFTSVSRKTH